MNPRPYRLGRREAATEETRARIIDAARDLLATGGSASFSIDAVARNAGVARMTVYYQFGSKQALLEALFDSIRARGPSAQLDAALAHPDPLEALATFLSAVGRFWDSDRLVIRRLRALAHLDPDFEKVVRARERLRRDRLRDIVRRVAERYGRPAPAAFDETVDLLFTLISFETFDTMAGSSRRLEEVAPLVYRLVRAALGVDRE